MAVDLFLKIEGVDGESLKTGHEGEIDILSFSFGASNSSSWAYGGTGAGTGKANLSDIQIMKYVDKASAALFKYCATGEHFASAVLSSQKSGGAAPILYYKIDLTKVLITSVQSSGSGGDDRITESLSLGYETIKFTYTEQADDGTAGAVSDAGYNVSTNALV